LQFRNEELYDDTHIRELQNRYGEALVILRHDVDLGPQLKLLGSLHYVNDPNTYICVIDDDALYSNGILHAYDEAIQAQKEYELFAAKVESIYGIQITPGFASFVIRRGALPKNFDDLVKKYSETSKECKRHDDFLFGSIFQDLQIKAYHVRNIQGPLCMPIGFGLDALHTNELSAVKHFQCSKSIWSERKTCATNFNTNFTLSIF
jgi:hypothetical protein